MPRLTPSKGLVRALAGSLLFALLVAFALAAQPSDTARQRIIELRAEIARHDELYFKKAAPEITDAAYDALKRELRVLEATQPAESAASAKSPAVPDDHTDGFAKAAHGTPMLSLEKGYTEDDLRAFCKRIENTLGQTATFLIEPKIDGLAVSAVYENGCFVRAVTRGNGKNGDDITANAGMLRSLPRELQRTQPDGTANPVPASIELRGEIYLSHAEFHRMNRERYAEGEPPLSHPRNAAVGTIKSRDPNETSARGLDVVFYGIGTCEPATAAPTSQQALHTQLRHWGLPVLNSVQIANGPDATWAAVQALGRQREKLAAPIDGAVIKLDTFTSRTQFGTSAEGPRWAIAYKYPPERVSTRLRAITLQVGRTGVLTPVAELDPVELAGSTVARASLHNREQITRLDVRIGDFVYLEKAGEIIPEIVGIDNARRPANATPYSFPATCPACQTAVIADPEVAAVRCPNAECPAQLQRRLAHFASRAGVNIAGLGEATLTELIARGMVKSAADFYRLKKDDLLKIPGIGSKSADQLLASIARSRQAELWRFLHGLGIPEVGPATAKTLAFRFPSLEKFASAQHADFPAALGPSAVKSIEVFLEKPANREHLRELAQLVQPAAPVSTSVNFTGKIFVLTGRLQTLTREDAVRRIEAVGGIVRDSVTKSTAYVVAGENAGEKLTKAKGLNIPVIDEAALLRLLNEKPE